MQVSRKKYLRRKSRRIVARYIVIILYSVCLDQCVQLEVDNAGTGCDKRGGGQLEPRPTSLKGASLI